MNIVEFKRDQYYTQTEACKKFKITPKVFKKILGLHSVNTITNDITLYTSPEGLAYPVTAIYVLKKDFELGLEIFKKQVTLDIEHT